MNVKRYCKMIWRRMRLVVRFSFVLLKLLFCRVAVVCKTVICRCSKRLSQLPKPSVFKSSFISRKSKPKDQQKQQEPREQLVDPISALVPISSDTASTSENRHTVGGLRELLASKVRFTRHLRILWVRRTMIVCAAAAVLCLLSASLLSLFRIKQIQIIGRFHYTEQQILSIADISVGDELFAISPKHVEQRLMDACPYLYSVDVERKGLQYHITLDEREVIWALTRPDGRVALLDEELYVPEICMLSELPGGVCLLLMELPLMEPSEEKDAIPQPQILTVGSQIVGESSALTLLEQLTVALERVTLPEPPTTLDLTDRYAVTMTLNDGTVVKLHECADAERQLTLAFRALEAYRKTHAEMPEGTSLCVDVDDFLRVSVRPIQKNDQ